MKKRLGYFLVVAVVLLAIIISYQMGKDNKEGKIEAILGNSLFNVWEGFNEIDEDYTEEISIETIKEMNRDFISMEAYANIVDRAVDHDLLKPIMGNLLIIGTDIENSYSQNGNFTENEVDKYKEVVKNARKINSLLLEIYYVDGSEGGVNLKIKNFEELVKINNQLSTLH